MAALLVMLVLVVWALWWTWPEPEEERLRLTELPARAGPPSARSPVVIELDLLVHSERPSSPPLPRRRGSGPRLTEDDLIAFGLALEASDDVVGELLEPST
jgi:hypothetical protein